jgi:hypothetical protein
MCGFGRKYSRPVSAVSRRLLKCKSEYIHFCWGDILTPSVRFIESLETICTISCTKPITLSASLSIPRYPTYQQIKLQRHTYQVAPYPQSISRSAFSRHHSTLGLFTIPTYQKLSTANASLPTKKTGQCGCVAHNCYLICFPSDHLSQSKRRTCLLCEEATWMSSGGYC